MRYLSLAAECTLSAFPPGCGQKRHYRHMLLHYTDIPLCLQTCYSTAPTPHLSTDTCHPTAPTPLYVHMSPHCTNTPLCPHVTPLHQHPSMFTCHPTAPTSLSVHMSPHCTNIPLCPHVTPLHQHPSLSTCHPTAPTSLSVHMSPTAPTPLSVHMSPHCTNIPLCPHVTPLHQHPSLSTCHSTAPTPLSVHMSLHCTNAPCVYKIEQDCHPRQRPRWQVDNAIGLSRVQQFFILSTSCLHVTPLHQHPSLSTCHSTAPTPLSVYRYMSPHCTDTPLSVQEHVTPLHQHPSLFMSQHCTNQHPSQSTGFPIELT